MGGWRPLATKKMDTEEVGEEGGKEGKEGEGEGRRRGGAMGEGQSAAAAAWGESGRFPFGKAESEGLGGSWSCGLVPTGELCLDPPWRCSFQTRRMQSEN